MGITIDTRAVQRAMDDLANRRLYHMDLYAHQAAGELAAQAKADAPWRDRTSLARGGITGRAERSGDRITITLSGSVRYMVYLELAHGKKWAVLWPTMERNAQRILMGFARIAGGG